MYEDGVFKPIEHVELEDKTEVELDIRPYVTKDEDIDDPKSFVGFIKNAPKGVPIAREHDQLEGRARRKRAMSSSLL